MDNKKANIIRAVFWGLITLLLLSAGITGAIYNNQIFKDRKNELENITVLFNNANILENYKTIGTTLTAKLKGKNIIVTYEGASTDEYTFKLKNGYLETTINKNDSIGKIIVMIISDSIAVNKGKIEGDTYSLFNNNLVLNYKLNDGIEYTLKNNNYIIKINLDTYLVKLPEELENEEFNITNIENDNYTN